MTRMVRRRVCRRVRRRIRRLFTRTITSAHKTICHLRAITRRSRDIGGTGMPVVGKCEERLARVSSVVERGSIRLC